MRRPLFVLLAAAVPLLLYARTSNFEFVRADDTDLIVGNQRFLSDLSNLPRAFARSYFEVEGELTSQKTYYRPVTIASFMIDASLGGANPRVYHATSVGLHAAASCLLLVLARAWGASVRTALAAALIFAVHPVNVQAVAWIAGRNDLLIAVFGLSSLLGWIASARAGTAVAGHVAAFALALFAKETGLFFPLIAVVHQRLVRRERLARAHWIALACDAAVVIVWAVLRNRALAGMPSDLSPEAIRTAIVSTPQLLVHAGKMLVPGRLNVSPGVDVTMMLAGVFAVIACAWVTWRWMARGVAVLMGCWFLAFLIPTLLVPGLPVYEHRAYVPLIGVLVGLAASQPRRLPSTSLGPAKPSRSVAMGLLLLAFAMVTWQRQEVFRDPFSYWTDGTRDRQFGPIAHVNLGQLQQAAGRLADARREYLEALARDPNTPKAHNNLGVVLMALDEPDLALEHFREETRRHPWNADGWFNLGLWNELRGDPREARRCYSRAIEANRNYVPAYEKLGLPKPARPIGGDQ